MKLIFAAVLAVALLALGGSAVAQPPPGSPFTGFCVPVIELRESLFDSGPERFGPIPLNCDVAGGFVVLLDVDGPNERLDPHNWSDVVAFTNGGPPNPFARINVVWYISDALDPATGIENGVSPADLASIGVTPADILGNPTTVFILEGQNTLDPSRNDYIASNFGYIIDYRVYSDPPEGPTPTRRGSWGRIKVLYR